MSLTPEQAIPTSWFLLYLGLWVVGMGLGALMQSPELEASLTFWLYLVSLIFGCFALSRVTKLSVEDQPRYAVIAFLLSVLGATGALGWRKVVVQGAELTECHLGETLEVPDGTYQPESN